MNHDEFLQNIIQAPINSGFNAKTTAKEVLGIHDLTGKVAIVTGGYSGIGLETTRALAEAGATIIVPVRTPEKARAAVVGIPNVELEELNLMDPDSIDAFTQRFLASKRSLHILINSAGIMAPPLRRDARGNESQLSTNHLGHFQMTAMLWPALKLANGARVVVVSSRGHRLGGVDFEDPNFEFKDYDKWKAYAQSKTANVLFALELDKRGKNYNVRTFSVHPGLVPFTDLGRDLTELKVQSRTAGSNENNSQFKNTEQGAATSIWCATSSQLNGMGGVYCEDCDISTAESTDSNSETGVWPWAIDPKAAEKLWKISESLSGVEFIF